MMLPKKWKARLAELLSRDAALRPFKVPLFPLNTVLFPGGVLSLRVFERRYMDMAKRCLRDDTPFGVCLIREGQAPGAAPVPHEVGTLARVAQWDMAQLDTLQLRALGLQRFAILNYAAEADGLLTGEVVRLPLEAPLPLPSQHAACSALLKQMVARAGSSRFAPPLDYEDGVWVSYRLAEMLPLKASAKQNMLEMNDTLVRLEVLHRFLAQQGLAN